MRLQRARRVLQKRLKVPPAINQFSKTLDKNLATNLFKILMKYRPEDDAQKKVGILADIVSLSPFHRMPITPPPSSSSSSGLYNEVDVESGATGSEVIAAPTNKRKADTPGLTAVVHRFGLDGGRRFQ